LVFGRFVVPEHKKAALVGHEDIYSGEGRQSSDLAVERLFDPSPLFLGLGLTPEIKLELNDF